MTASIAMSSERAPLGLTKYECWITTPDGYEVVDVLASDEDTARCFMRQYRYGKDIDVYPASTRIEAQTRGRIAA